MIPIILALIMGGCRVVGFKSAAFQAFAHLYVGGLFGVWWGKRPWDGIAAHPSRVYLATAIALSLLELLCFLLLPR